MTIHIETGHGVPRVSANLKKDGTGDVLDSPAAQFQDELDSIFNGAADEDCLRGMVLDCLMRHRDLAAAAWVAVDGRRAQLPARINNPALQQPAILDWVASQCRCAAEAGSTLIVASRQVRNLTLIGLPLALPDGRAEALALMSADADPRRIDEQSLAGRTAVDAVVRWHSRLELQELAGQMRTTSALLELRGRLESAADVKEAARRLADSLRDYLNCDLAAVGICRRGGLTTALRAVAGQAEFDRNSPRARRIKAALDEALVRGEVASWPGSEASQHQLLAQRKLAQSVPCETVVSIPLHDPDGKPVGAVTVGGAASLCGSEAQQFLATLAVPVSGSLQVVRRAQRGPVRRAVSSLLGPGRGRLLAGLMLLAGIALLMFLPMPYRIACQFRCEAVERQYCVAPYDGLVQQTLVEPGDLVRKGQVLARMDDREIHYEMTGLAAQQQRAAKQRDVHLANEQVSESFMAALEVDRVDSRSQLLRLRLSNLEIRSPADGVVLTGSLDRRDNYPVNLGQLLYEVAPLDPLRVEVAVPADEIEHVRPEMVVELRFDSSPRDLRRGRIKRIRPRSEAVDDQNVFVAEVEVPNPDCSLRPGMEGSARIVSNSHPLGWNLFHRAYEHALSTYLW